MKTNGSLYAERASGIATGFNQNNLFLANSCIKLYMKANMPLTYDNFVTS